MFLTKKFIPRRTFLTGAGVMIGASTAGEFTEGGDAKSATVPSWNSALCGFFLTQFHATELPMSSSCSRSWQASAAR